MTRSFTRATSNDTAPGSCNSSRPRRKVSQERKTNLSLTRTKMRSPTQRTSQLWIVRPHTHYDIDGTSSQQSRACHAHLLFCDFYGGVLDLRFLFSESIWLYVLGAVICCSGRDYFAGRFHCIIFRLAMESLACCGRLAVMFRMVSLGFVAEALSYDDCVA